MQVILYWKTYGNDTLRLKLIVCTFPSGVASIVNPEVKIGGWYLVRNTSPSNGVSKTGTDDSLGTGSSTSFILPW